MCPDPLIQIRGLSLGQYQITALLAYSISFKPPLGGVRYRVIVPLFTGEETEASRH